MMTQRKKEWCVQIGRDAPLNARLSAFPRRYGDIFALMYTSKESFVINNNAAYFESMAFFSDKKRVYRRALAG